MAGRWLLVAWLLRGKPGGGTSHLLGLGPGGLAAPAELPSDEPGNPLVTRLPFEPLGLDSLFGLLVSFESFESFALLGGFLELELEWLLILAWLLIILSSNLLPVLLVDGWTAGKTLS